MLRLDIEGMRAIAVGAVLAFHAGLPWFTGGFVGVDVFFVLSGFLITGLLAREVARTGRIRMAHFWARRIKRLLPASATVLAFSALVTYVWLPITQRQDFGGDIVSAALYVVNWRLADRSVDYLAEDIGASPVQHYWSLSVEEQFYVLWPLLMVLVALVAAKRWKLGAFGVLGLVTLASFAYSVQQSHSNPGTAFFVSTTRIWELGIGALLALAATRVGRLPGVLRAVGGWVGLAAIAYAAIAFDGSTTWPGVNALVPTVGAALMIASGITSARFSPQRLLSAPPMVWIGGLSYSIYLWHWPILIAAQAKYPHLRLRWTVLLMIASVVPAWLCHKLIENPVRFGAPFKPTARALGIGAALTALGVGIGFALNASIALGDVVKEASPANSPGALALKDPANAGVVWSDIKAVDEMRPLPVDAPKDRPPQYDTRKECQVLHGAKPEECDFGDLKGDHTVVIVGDSKIVQWQTALSSIAKDQDWKLVQLTKSACPFTAAQRGGPDGDNCHAWGETVMRRILAMKPDLVITSQRHSTALPPGKTTGDPRDRESMQAGLVDYWSKLTKADIPVVAFLDNPAPSTVVYECVAQHSNDLPACAFDKRQGIRGSAAGVQRAAAAQVPGVAILDMADTVCPDAGRCAPVIGNVLVYRQGTHLTRSFVDSAKDQLSAELWRATHGLFGARSVS
jgi:peptidoglycan/LPS O-acetylase OafA/YrhL